MWGLGLRADELGRLAIGLGADVPYFLKGRALPGGDIGDSLTPLPDLAPLACLVAFPPFPHLDAVHLRRRRAVLDFLGESQ